jgi:hypothetical protein
MKDLPTAQKPAMQGLRPIIRRRRQPLIPVAVEPSHALPPSLAPLVQPTVGLPVHPTPDPALKLDAPVAPVLAQPPRTPAPTPCRPDEPPPRENLVFGAPRCTEVYPGVPPAPLAPRRSHPLSSGPDHFAAAARLAGCLRDQVEKFIRASVLLQPKQLAARLRKEAGHFNGPVRLSESTDVIPPEETQYLEPTVDWEV